MAHNSAPDSFHGRLKAALAASEQLEKLPKAERQAAALTAEEAHQQAAAEGLKLLALPNTKSGWKNIAYHSKKKNFPYDAHIGAGEGHSGQRGDKIRLGTFATGEEAALCYARVIGREANAELSRALDAAMAAAASPASTAQDIQRQAEAEGLSLLRGNTTSGFKEVQIMRGGQFGAQITGQGKTVWLGSFGLAEEAALAVARHRAKVDAAAAAKAAGKAAARAAGQAAAKGGAVATVVVREELGLGASGVALRLSCRAEPGRRREGGSKTAGSSRSHREKHSEASLWHALCAETARQEKPSTVGGAAVQVHCSGGKPLVRAASELTRYPRGVGSLGRKPKRRRTEGNEWRGGDESDEEEWEEEQEEDEEQEEWEAAPGEAGRSRQGSARGAAQRARGFFAAMEEEGPEEGPAAARQLAQEEGLLRAEDVHMVEAVVVDDTHEVDEVVVVATVQNP